MAAAGDLEQRLRLAVGSLAPTTEKRMFGGTCFMWRDHMLCCTNKRGFLFRVGEEKSEAALTRPGAKIMIHGGRRMKGYIWVDPGACDARSLRGWVDLARSHVETLPPRTGTRTGRRRR